MRWSIGLSVQPRTRKCSICTSWYWSVSLPLPIQGISLRKEGFPISMRKEGFPNSSDRRCFYTEDLMQRMTVFQGFILIETHIGEDIHGLIIIETHIGEIELQNLGV